MAFPALKMLQTEICQTTETGNLSGFFFPSLGQYHSLWG